MRGLHTNKEQWQKPEEFIPERFDVNSPWSLTPSGEKRDPYSYMPFFGGKRVCFGKLFAETVSRMYSLLLINSFDIEFEDPHWMTHFPELNFMQMD